MREEGSLILNCSCYRRTEILSQTIRMYFGQKIYWNSNILKIWQEVTKHTPRYGHVLIRPDFYKKAVAATKHSIIIINYLCALILGGYFKGWSRRKPRKIDWRFKRGMFSKYYYNKKRINNNCFLLEDSIWTPFLFALEWLMIINIANSVKWFAL